MKFLKLLLSFVLISILAMTNIAVQAKQLPGEKKEGNINYLFIDVAEHGSLQKNKDGDTYTLTLTGADDYVSYFSDVPHRITGIMSLENFKQLINKETAEKYTHGLNSGLIAVEAGTKNKIRYILSLSNLNYDAKTETATFTAKVVPGEQKMQVPDAIKFKHISLFIDSMNINKKDSKAVGICASCDTGIF